MAGDTKNDGEASEPAGRPLVDPLLESFADRYLHAWGQRELGRIDSPLYLVPQLNDAAELFERGRQRWRTFDQLGAPREERGAIVRDFDRAEWTASIVTSARDAHRLLLTHSRFDLAKPDELDWAELRLLTDREIPTAVLYASVAMRCAQDAADECYRLSRCVEDYAERALKVDLATLHESDNDAWIDRVRDALRDLAGDAAEAREYIATYLGAARAALALAAAAENSENLDQLDREFLALWEATEGYFQQLERDPPEGGGAGFEYFTSALLPVRALEPLPQIKAMASETARLVAERRERESKARAALDLATAKKMEAGAATRKLVEERFPVLRAAHPLWSDDQVCEEIAAELSANDDTGRNWHKTTVRKHARALGLLRRQVVEKKSENTAGSSNSVK